jgi:hypothetical protein
MGNGTATLASRGRSWLIWAAWLFIAVMLTGFARTYYLKFLYGTPALLPLVHVHGLLMTAWFVLLLLQLHWVSKRRIDLHRRFGMVGGFIAVAMVIVGTLTAISAARRGVSPGPPPLLFLAIPLAGIWLFAVLIGLGLWWKARPEVHKRLVILASIALLPAAVARIPIAFIAQGGPPVFYGLTDLLALVLIVQDSVRYRRLHAAYGWGFLALLGSQFLSLAVTSTHWWMSFAQWLVR